MNMVIYIILLLCVVYVIYFNTNNNKVVFTKNHYHEIKNVSWDDVKRKVLFEIQHNMGQSMDDVKNPIAYNCESFYLPGTVHTAYNEVINSKSGKKLLDDRDLHIYVSYKGKCKTIGNHNDEENVLIVQSIGSVQYRINGEIYTLNPGDSLYIPSGVYHEPIVSEPRVTFSFS